MATPIQPPQGKNSSQRSAQPIAPPLQESTAIIQVIERAALNPEVDIDKLERL